MAGGTWRIIVEEGSQKSPTQSSIYTSGREPKMSKVERESKKAQKEIEDKGKRVIAVGLGMTMYGINQYLSITGETALRNRLNTAVGFGALLATGRIGTAVSAYAVKQINFSREVMEQNATAERLRQQSNTSVSQNRGDMYTLKF